MVKLMSKSHDVMFDKTNAGFLGRNSTAILQARFLDYLDAMRENKKGFGKSSERQRKWAQPQPSCPNRLEMAAD
jgi:hypothetical protein